MQYNFFYPVGFPTELNFEELYSKLSYNFKKIFKMAFTDRHIVETYSSLFETLSSSTKIDLIESLTKSLKKEKTNDHFFKSFGAFASTKSPKEIYKDIKNGRKFRKKDWKF